MTKLDAENRYNDYLDGHTGNVAEALELLHSLNIEYVNNNYDKLKEICSVHDKSKYEEPEYTPYRKHYYPITEDEKLETEAYDNANLHHVKNNKHHWNYWLNDETGELEIPDEEEYKLYCVERCCDWLAMAGQRNQVLNEWYNANKQYIQMPDYGWEICDEIMSKVPEHYDFSFKGTRGKLDESTLHEEDIYDLEQRIIELKGKKYLDAIYSKSKGHAGYWALKKIVNSLEDKQSEKSVKTSDNGISDEEYNNIMNDLSKQKKIKHVHYDASYETDESNEEKDAIRKELGESFGNSGYVGQSKSVRAFAAEEEEKYPASECDKLLGVRSGATKAVLLPSEWHHTGSYYKETDYYDIRLLLAIKNNDEEVMSEYNEDEIKEAKQKYEDLKQWKKPELQSNTYKADVEWLTWSGTRKYPKATKHSVKNADVEERGSYYYFNDEHGIPTKKMIGSNGTRVKRIDESFKVSRGEKGYLLEANMKQLKRKTISEDPTRAKKSKHVQSKYIGISKYGVLNFETSSETHSGVKWYQEIHFPSFSGFMNIVEQGDTIDAEDVKKAMSSDNIKISCFTEDTEVQTLDGMKKIKDIKVGDKVLTHTGKYQDVLQTFENDYNGEMIEINGVKSTPNHPYLVKLPDGSVEWKMACEITKDMKLLEVEE